MMENEAIQLSREMFDRFAFLVHQRSGIYLAPPKIPMLQSRLQKRLKAVGVSGFEAYYRMLKNDKDHEMRAFINAVTTNKTDFYREPHHFDVLKQEIQTLCQRTTSCAPAHVLSGGHGELNVWSAGCSTGEEPYTIGMLLADIPVSCRAGFRILATDIDTTVLKTAANAIYPQADIAALPKAWQRKYFLRGTDRYTGYFRIVPELRKKVQFRQLNFNRAAYDVPHSMDIIFCRNVMIYFRSELKARLIHNFYQHLRPGGYLFIGHSESLAGIQTAFETVAPTVFKKPDQYPVS